MLHHLDDVRSDLSVFHRIDDADAMPARRFWSLAERLWCYQGAVAIQQRARLIAEAEPPPASMSAGPVPSTAPIITADQQQIDAMLSTPLYGDLPGLGPVFSHSTAPLI